ncbi:MFS transporter [Stutzerimonas azotifigens]|uniref:MFS transporter n=1 Tax=Stutzerimonas azotifigens TaxID=291995 RepID=UPI00041DAEAD|nr:MFS transporter [Stutzerimonas azotifigens]
MTQAQPSDRNSTLLLLSLVVFNFFSFVSIGIPLAVLPSFVHDQLGYSATIAGMVVGLQYLVTLLCRPLAGRLADELGAKKTVMIGMLSCAGAGVLLLASAWLEASPGASVAVMLVSRVLLGFTQSLIGISGISWGLNTFGTEHAPRIISWNGVAAYGGVGVGAPLGALLNGTLGFWSLGALTTLIALTGFYLASRKGPAPLNRGKRLPFRQVLWRVLPVGMSLALGTMGYGTLSAFIALYYAARGWDGAAWCLTAYACTFIGTRLLFPNLINRVGGYPVALGCLAVECVGLLLLWLAETPTLALAGSALAGAGLSLLYPALGVGVIARVGANNGSAGLSVFAMFFDLALGLAGAVMGVLATWAGLRSTFFAALLMGLAGLALAAWLRKTQRAADEAVGRSG